jgi:hypothetical protein
MHLLSQSAWFTVASLAFLGPVVGAGGVMEFDLAFPRNETYAPTGMMPVVFAFQNAEHSELVRPYIVYSIRNASDLTDVIPAYRHELSWADSSSQEPYFAYKSWALKAEGTFQVLWTVEWLGCYERDSEDSDLPGFVDGLNSATRTIEFSIKNGGPAVDLVAATANDKTCAEEFGVAINATGPTAELEPGGTCVVLESLSATLTPNPCQVRIDSAAAASISTAVKADLCASATPPADLDCTKNSAARRLAVAGVACLTAALGALGYLLM